MGIWVKQQSGVTAISSFHETSNGTYQYIFEIGKLSIVGGSKLTKTVVNCDWVTLFTYTDLQTLFGPAFNIEHLGVFTFNGDSKALNSHFYSPEVYYSGNFGVYQYFYPVPASVIDMRINYMLTYYG